MLEEKTNLRSKDIKGTETYGKRPATMNQTHQVIGTCAAHISWNLRSRDSEVELEYIRRLFSEHVLTPRNVFKEENSMIQSLAECWYVQSSKLSCFSLALFKLVSLIQCFFISSFFQFS